MCAKLACASRGATLLPEGSPFVVVSQQQYAKAIATLLIRVGHRVAGIDEARDFVGIILPGQLLQCCCRFHLSNLLENRQTLLSKVWLTMFNELIKS